MYGEGLARTTTEAAMRALIISLLVVGTTLGACSRGTVPAPLADGGTTTTYAAEPAVSRSTADTVVATAGGAAETWREVTIPAGTLLPIVLDTSVGSDTSTVEDPVQAHIPRAVTIHGRRVLLQGSRVSGVVTNATRSGRVKGLAHVAIRFDTLVPEGVDQRYSIRTAAVGRTAQATKKKDALEIGAPAAGGALVGALLGGKKGALIGTAVGGGAGTAVVLSTRGKEIRLARGAALKLRLTEPVTIRVRS